jgi:Xaa-Pro aminopeptidase
MSLEAWNTAASVATFVVIAATALNAVVQLRHIRRANELAGLHSAFDADGAGHNHIGSFIRCGLIDERIYSRTDYILRRINDAAMTRYQIASTSTIAPSVCGVR